MLRISRDVVVEYESSDNISQVDILRLMKWGLVGEEDERSDDFAIVAFDEDSNPLSDTTMPESVKN
jgi:hypothetical protein